MNQFLNMVDGGRNQTYEWPLKANCEKIWPESQASLFSKPFWTFLLLVHMKNWEDDYFLVPFCTEPLFKEFWYYDIKQHFNIKRVLGNENEMPLVFLCLSKLLRVATDLKCARNIRWRTCLFHRIHFCATSTFSSFLGPNGYLTRSTPFEIPSRSKLCRFT